MARPSCVLRRTLRLGTRITAMEIEGTTSGTITIDEAKFVFERGCEQLILGSGQMGNVHLSPEAEAYFAKKGCEVLLQPTPEAIGAFNRSHAKKIGLFHVTC